MPEKRTEILETSRYYQSFHHKCIGWYITIMGLFIAGTIANDSSRIENETSVGWSVVVFSLLVSVSFFIVIFHYSARLSVLGEYLSGKKPINDDWYECSSNVMLKVTGVGSAFFWSIILILQGAVIWMTLLKFKLIC